jgi:putative hemin transport protein
LQFFDRAGAAIHKVYLTEESNAAAYDKLISKYQIDEPRLPAIESVPVIASEKSSPDDVAAFRAAWMQMTDTHDFVTLLRKFNVSRLGALHAADNELAREVDGGAVEYVLQQAAATELPIMCFVANRGIVQIHSGPIKNLQRTGPWYNVLDPHFNLHLNTTAIASSWVVTKPTADGDVTSLELFAANGDLIVQFFGERKPGKPELPEWRALLARIETVKMAS